MTEATEQGARLAPLDILFGFEGRIGIGTFWSYFLTVWVAGFALGVSRTVMDRGLATGLAVFLYVAGAYLSGALIAKRLQDSGRHPGMLFFVLVPFVGLVWLIVLGVWPTESPNEYGPEAGYRYKSGEGLESYKAAAVFNSKTSESGVNTNPADATVSDTTIVEQLERLSSLHESNQLTDEEFQNMKRLLIPDRSGD